MEFFEIETEDDRAADDDDREEKVEEIINDSVLHHCEILADDPVEESAEEDESCGDGANPDCFDDVVVCIREIAKRRECSKAEHVDEEAEAACNADHGNAVHAEEEKRAASCDADLGILLKQRRKSDTNASEDSKNG